MERQHGRWAPFFFSSQTSKSPTVRTFLSSCEVLWRVTGTFAEAIDVLYSSICIESMRKTSGELMVDTLLSRSLCGPAGNSGLNSP